MEQRLLDPEPVPTLDDYRKAGGGRGLDAARRLGQAGTIDDVEASGLRGRGGAGFPTGVKWRTVAENRSPALSATVVVNAAEGEPGTFKDRTLMRRNPYRLLEGALVAAGAVGANEVVIALKATFRQELERVRAAIAEVQEAGWGRGVELLVVEGPSHYLYGEETALLEVIDGRNPFPRIAPPFRRGVVDLGPDQRVASRTALAGPDAETVAPPTLVNNVETLSNVPLILAEGADWYRTVGTAKSPGTILCTVTGRTRRHGVGELPMGTPLREVIDVVGGGVSRERQVLAVMSGVANALVPESLLDTPVDYESMQEIGSGLGSAGFIVFDDSTDLAAVAAGVSRFLAVESCGQCTPCKQDGLALAGLLEGVRDSRAGESDLAAIEERVGTVSDEARCYLAHQHQAVLESIMGLFPEALRRHVDGRQGAAHPELVAAIVDIVDGVATLDESHLRKQPDWTYDEVYSGQSPADRVDESVGDL